ncbi:MAG: hypothetical protein ACXV79_07320 [Methylobacter sp.]
MKYSIKTLILTLLFFQINTFTILYPSTSAAASNALYVRGYVFAEVNDKFQKHQEIALPHAQVFLVDMKDTSTPVASNLSDLSGHFNLKTDQIGGKESSRVFQVCVKAEGFQDACATERITRSSDVGHIAIHPISKDKSAAAFGTISLHDGNLARGFEPMLGVNAYPTIQMKSSSGQSYQGYVNNQGGYIVPNVPTNEEFVLRASIEKETVERKVGKNAALLPNIGHPFTFQFNNSAPKVRLVSASLNNKLLQVAAPGSTIKLRAVAADVDKDALEYRWLTPDMKPIAVPSNSPEFAWKVPAQDGVHTVRVLVSDARGGYASGFINVRAGNGGVTFSGTVVDQANQPISGAEVDVNGRLTNSNAKGLVKLTVPVQDKYVLTIRQPSPNSPGKPAYGTVSYIYSSGIQGQRWVLRSAVVKTADPTQPIALQHVRTQKDCDALRPQSSKIDWKPYLKPGLFDWQDGRGNSLSITDIAKNNAAAATQVTRLLSYSNSQLAKFFYDAAGLGMSDLSGKSKTPTKNRDEKPPYISEPLPCLNGIKVEIPANSLENPVTKKPPTGPVQVAVSMVDLNGPNQMPGDYTGIDTTSGQLTDMESFGAGSVEIRSGMERFNLKPGTSATVTLPVDSTQLVGKPTLPAKMPFLFYDESTGIWKQDGTAVLSGSGTSSAYVASTKHFSTMNGDILKTPGERACVAVEVDPASGFTFPLDVEVNLQPSVVNPTTVQVRTLTINASGEHSVIYNLPKKQDIALILPGSFSEGAPGTSVPAGVFVVNTGDPQTSPSAPPTPNPDGTYYGEDGSGNATGPCSSRVVLKKLNVSTAPGAPHEFLQGLNFQASNIDEFKLTDPAIADAIVQGAKDYYKQADPRNARPTLDKFKEVNRFGLPQNPPNEVEYSAFYANGGDLGFGREMHCRRNPAADGKSDYACYVTNYGQPPKFTPDQQDAEDAALGPIAGHADATVAMEYSRVENPIGDPAEFPNNDRAVKFYAYNTNGDPAATPPIPAGTQVFAADLDGHGARPLPNLCVVCHGGQSADAAAGGGAKKPAYLARTDIISENSVFLPFDLHYFKFPAANPKAAQENTFRILNIEFVKQVATQIPTDSGTAISELIDLWYPGGAGNQLDDAYSVIAGWNTGAAVRNPPSGNTSHQDNQMYRDVFARSCRTCHVAQPYTGQTFTSAASFKSQISSVQSRVCIDKVMPHAQRTSDIFWTSLNPSMPGFLEIYGQPQPGWLTDINSQCGLFNQDSKALKSFFEGTVYPVLTANCAGGGCHSNVGNAKFKVGSPAAMYDELLNTPTNGGGKYIKPNDLANSLLYQKIIGAAPGQKMPIGGPDLTSADTNANGKPDAVDIKDWIEVYNAFGP